jgi:hypothetical protein
MFHIKLQIGNFVKSRFVTLPRSSAWHNRGMNCRRVHLTRARRRLLRTLTNGEYHEQLLSTPSPLFVDSNLSCKLPMISGHQTLHRPPYSLGTLGGVVFAKTTQAPQPRAVAMLHRIKPICASKDIRTCKTAKPPTATYFSSRVIRSSKNKSKRAIMRSQLQTRGIITIMGYILFCCGY